jgi:TATA-box binding protein (TBP) (component of TFIID and TFIIIB)
MTLNPSPLRVSTMTVSGHLGAIPDLERLYTHCAFIPYWLPEEGVIKIKYGGAMRGICSEDILHSTAKAKSRFFNQASMVFRLQLTDGGRWKETNIKLFKNGSFQMTGINSEEMARAALTRMIALNHTADRAIWPADAQPHITKFNVCMMNSDYNVGAAIRRDRLYTILVKEYGLWSNFEPTIYQGVNTKYFWNDARPAGAPPGICACPAQCEGDGDGHGIGCCKKITISPFRTGSVIVTGAKELRQLQDAYTFLNSILAKYATEVLRPNEPAVEAPAPRTKRLQPAPTNAVEILRLKKQSSPRALIRAAVATQ